MMTKKSDAGIAIDEDRHPISWLNPDHNNEEAIGYLMASSGDGRIKGHIRRGLCLVTYHAPCHGRVQSIGNITEKFLRLIADTEVYATK